MTGYKTQSEALSAASAASTNPSARQLGDGSWVGIGDAAPNRGSSIWHKDGMDYLLDLDDATQGDIWQLH